MCKLKYVDLGSMQAHSSNKYCKLYESKEKFWVIVNTFLIPKSSPIKVSMYTIIYHFHTN